jgi:hypothetical protein
MDQKRVLQEIQLLFDVVDSWFISYFNCVVWMICQGSTYSGEDSSAFAGSTGSIELTDGWLPGITTVNHS